MNHTDLKAVLVPSSASTVKHLHSLVAELITALSSALNDERDSAEDSLSRAVAMLETVDAAHAPEVKEFKGGLAPWQIRKVTAYIESNLDRSLRSSELAKLLHLSPGYFSRTFRNTFGCAPLQYVTRRRMECAQGLMLSTNKPLAQIALECGLSDQPHFSRLFRRFVGESPREWRRARMNAGRKDVGANALSAELARPGVGRKGA